MDLDVPFIPEKSECATITALPPGSEARVKHVEK